MKFFGLEIKKEEPVGSLDSIAPPAPDGAVDVLDVGANSYYFDFDVTLKNDKDLIQTYREIARISDVDDALDDIINECIVVEDQEQIVEIMLDNTKFSDGIKKKIVDEFEYLLGLLNFHDCGDQIFRQWYIDGRHYYHKVIDTKKQKEGIQALHWLDPTKTKKVRELDKKTVTSDGKSVEVNHLKSEYFLYDPTLTISNDGISNMPFNASQAYNIMKLNLDSVAYTTSGQIDLDSGKVLGYIHKAIKPANQLSLMEDSMVVYRLTRAPERRIFYIDIGNLGASRAEQYVVGLMNKYKNKLVYDVKTGSVEASKAHLSMMEDIWLPRKEGGRGTEVDTLPAGANLGDIDDILYFKRRLTKAMRIPVSRTDSEQSLSSIGVSGEVNRDELKFTKYVDKVRRRFNTFFYDLLKTQLVLKGVMSADEWDNAKSRIGFLYNRDSYIAELQKSEMWRQRFDLLTTAIEFTGENNYLSQEWNRDNILKLSEADRIKIKKDQAGEPDPEEIKFGQGDEGADEVEEAPPGGDEPAKPAPKKANPNPDDKKEEE